MDDFIAITSYIAAVNNPPPGVIINTLCLKEGCFPKLDAGAMVEQLAAFTCALMTRAGAGDVGRWNKKQDLKAISCNEIECNDSLQNGTMKQRPRRYHAMILSNDDNNNV